MINANTTWMLKNIGAEFAQELPVLVVNLDLMSRRALGNDEVASSAIDRYSKNRVQQR